MLEEPEENIQQEKDINHIHKRNQERTAHECRNWGLRY